MTMKMSRKIISPKLTSIRSSIPAQSIVDSSATRTRLLVGDNFNLNLSASASDAKFDIAPESKSSYNGSE